jgi:hypothetical protein
MTKGITDMKHILWLLWIAGVYAGLYAWLSNLSQGAA